MTIRARTICLIGTLLISAAVPVLAQAQAQPAAAPPQTTLTPAAYPTFEATGGYQVLHVPDNWFPFGLNVDGAWNFDESLGLVGEIGWAMDSEEGEDELEEFEASAHVWTFAAGPRFNMRPSGRLWPFAQVLAGAWHARLSTEFLGEELSDSTTKFMIQPGAGVNVNMGDGWGLVGQVDYRRVFLDEEDTLDGESGENEIRVFVGVRLLLD